MSEPRQISLAIDGLRVVAAEGTNILKAAEQAGIAIPHFCYHPALQVEGNCRMCLVEIEGLPKLDLACSNLVREGMVVRTSSERVRQARKDVLEFLLAEHPLDCPICDKAGECRLQDYYDRHGRYAGRMAEPRERRDKKVPIGRELILDRERCILCTRCVRFLRQVTGTGELGVFERSLRSEVGTYDETPVDNDYSRNLVDICPVGAITSKDFRFKTRAWFLSRKPSICPHCGRGCAVVVESVKGYPLGKGERRVYRITARENPAVNGFWICDIGRNGRHDIDEKRTVTVLKEGVPVHGVSWQKALAGVAASLKAVPGPERAAKIVVVLNSRLTCEELAMAKGLFVAGLGVVNVFFADRKPGCADGLLLTAERVPNGRGVLDAGFAPRLPRLEDLASADVVLVFGPDLAEYYAEDALSRVLGRIPEKYLFAAHGGGPLEGLANAVIPVAVPAEKSGTYINIDGVRQAFDRAVTPPAGVVPEGAILMCLANVLGIAVGDADVR